MAPPHTTPTAKTARKEWPEPLLWQAVGMRRIGAPSSAITTLTGIPKSTLAGAWARYAKTGQVKSAARSGRPKKTDDRQLLVSGRRERRLTYEQLRQGFAVDVSVSTIKRRLGTVGVRRQRER